MSGTLSIRQAAAAVGCSHQTLYRAAKATGQDGEIVPGVSHILPGVVVFLIGSDLKVSRIQVEEYLASPEARAS